MALLCRELGDNEKAEFWRHEADVLGWAFRRAFWKDGRFAEYIHPKHGPITRHVYTDTDFAAIACGLADGKQKERLWDTLKAQDFWAGGMPTRLVTNPDYLEWELGQDYDLGRLWSVESRSSYEVAAMGRVWHSELYACLKTRNYDRIRESVKLVCQMGLAHDGYWHECYHLSEDGKAIPAPVAQTKGPTAGYCEYPAILTRFVLSHLELFE